MEIFELQLTFLKFCGIAQFSATRMKILKNIFTCWLYIATFYYMVSAVAYAITSDDVLKIAESLAPVFSGTYSVVKLAVLLLYQDQFFDIIDEIRKLNKKCKAKNVYSNHLKFLKVHTVFRE